MLIHGSCHCGNIHFTLNWLPAPTEIPARACGCSVCSKRGGVWTASPTAALEVRISEPAQVTPYSFGTHTAQFHVCQRCGVVPVVTSLIADQLYAVVSVNAMDDVDQALLRFSPANFDEESAAQRLARRARNWIAQVKFIEGDALSGN